MIAKLVKNPGQPSAIRGQLHVSVQLNRGSYGAGIQGENSYTLHPFLQHRLMALIGKITKSLLSVPTTL